MGKKKGKGQGQGQSQSSGGDQSQSQPSTSAETLPSQQQLTPVQESQQQQQGRRKKKGSKGQQEVASSPQKEISQEQLASQPQQQQGGPQQRDPQQQQQTGPQEPQQRDPRQQQQGGRKQQQKKGAQQQQPRGPQEPQQRDSQQQQQGGPQQQQQGGPQQQQQGGPQQLQQQWIPQQQQQQRMPQQQWFPQQQQRMPQQHRMPQQQWFPQQQQQHQLSSQQLPPGFISQPMSSPGFTAQQQQMQMGTGVPRQPHGPPFQMHQPRGPPPGMRPQSPPQMSPQFPPGAVQQPPSPSRFQSPPPQGQQVGGDQQRQPLPQEQVSPPIQQTQVQGKHVPQQRQQQQHQQQQHQQQQQQQQRQQQQRQQQQRQQQQPRQGQAQVKASEKEQSPPLGGQGDCLQNMALVKPGTKGRKIIVESNHLALNLGTQMDAIHYDVNIIPDTPKSLLRDVMLAFGRKHYPKRHPAFDGRKNLFSPIKLPFGDTDSLEDTVKVEGENGPKEFRVEIKFARMVDLSPLHEMLKAKATPQDALQCLDIVLRNAPANSCISAGRCFFTPPSNQIIPLGDGMEMYYGFYQSAIRGWKALLNVDVAHKAFPQALELLDLICDLGSDFRFKMTREHLNRPLNDNLFRSLDKFIKTLKVKYEITGQSGSKRIYRVNGLGEAPSRAKFKLDNGKETTVDAYFQTVKRVKLRYPHLPSLWVGARDRDSKILLPVEFCTVVEGQAVNRKMNENQTSNMIKKAATSTDIRKQRILNTIEKVDFNSDPCVKEFGFSVNNQFERLTARILQPPTLLYADNMSVKPSKGVWRSDRNKFLIGAQINKWTIACVTRQPCKVEQFADQIFRFASSNGMQMTSKATPPFVHVTPNYKLQDIVNYFRTKQDYDLIFVVVPNSGPQYSYVKQAAELNVGCLTQCVKEKTMFKMNPQTVGNILLKVNSKMNGTNHTFNPTSRPPIMNRPCMIMGADVTHPSPDAKDIPSVAAVTASHDPKAFQYNICWRLQPPKMEIIDDLFEITKEQLMYFYKRTNHKPERIVFFRDGVSEGQFKEVQRAEIRAIQQACKALQRDGYEPTITFLVVQKRHHTRLFPTDSRDSEDRNMNVPAGTCVDTNITNPTMQDFYLVSHASIQGVAKPTKYCTLWDDNNMSNDDIEELTYHLCHMFTRCNRSVSYPAPTYYAHLAAARAKVYIENDKLNMDNLKKHQQSYQIKECISKQKPMFFV